MREKDAKTKPTAPGCTPFDSVVRAHSRAHKTRQPAPAGLRTRAQRSDPAPAARPRGHGAWCKHLRGAQCKP
jgi:hypothetical protein